MLPKENYKTKKISYFLAYDHVSKKKKKKIHIIFSYNKNLKIYFSMHFDFNNQFIKVMRTRLIFQKHPKKLFYFLLVSGVMTF
jgi:hypothetical protein